MVAKTGPRKEPPFSSLYSGYNDQTLFPVSSEDLGSREVTHLFSQSLNQLLSTCCVLSTVLGAEDKTGSKRECLCPAKLKAGVGGGHRINR